MASIDDRREDNVGYVMAVMWLNQQEWLTADEVASNTKHSVGGWLTWQASSAALKRCYMAGLIYRKRLGEGESRSAWAYHVKGRGY